MHWGRAIGSSIFLGMILPWLICGAVIPRQTGDTSSITLTVLKRERAETMDLETYLQGVMQGEMPASFEEEALRAQAVAARTFTLLTIQRGKKHGKGTICTISACCQDYVEGTPDPKICKAVADTKGMVLTYGGELIEATYFACSGGRTERALDVWGSDVPYLQSVPSLGEEGARHEQEDFVFPKSLLWELLELPTGADLSPQICNRTVGGGVEEIRLGDVLYTGLELRKRLHLNSTDFTVTETEEALIFHTIGFGHRVGLSQYGAQAMAKKGAAYLEILDYYYPGTECQDLRDIPLKSFQKKEKI